MKWFRWHMLALLLVLALTFTPAMAANPPIWSMEDNWELVWNRELQDYQFVHYIDNLGVAVSGGAPNEEQSIYYNEFDQNGNVVHSSLYATVTFSGSGCQQPEDYCADHTGSLSACSSQGSCSVTALCPGYAGVFTFGGTCLTGCLAMDPFPEPGQSYCNCGAEYCTCQAYINCPDPGGGGTWINGRRFVALQRTASMTGCGAGIPTRPDGSCDFDLDNEQDPDEPPCAHCAVELSQQ
jgi:hypothetical protein